MCLTQISTTTQMIDASRREVSLPQSLMSPSSYEPLSDLRDVTQSTASKLCREGSLSSPVLSSMLIPQSFKMPSFGPTPIDQASPVRAVPRIDSLPVKMKQYCEEYIAALSHLSGDEECFTLAKDTSHAVPRVPLNCSLPKQDMQLLENCISPLRAPSSIEERGVAIDMIMQVTVNDKIHPYQHERWNERYQDLLLYYQEHQHCNVPYVFKQNPCLGQWVKRQRHQYKLFKQGLHSNLNERRIEALNMLGFIWDSHGTAWENNFQELQEFRKLHGHVNVPCTYRGSSKLSTWIKRQRRQYRLFQANQTSTIDSQRIARLEKLGLVWDYYGSGK